MSIIKGYWLTDQGFIDKPARLEIIVAKDGDTAKYFTHHYQSFDDDGIVTAHAETYGADGGTYLVAGMRVLATTLVELARVGMVPRQMRKG